MNTETITSDLGKDVIRVYGDKLSDQEKEFLLHYENIAERVFASRDQVASMFYLHARQHMNDIVGYHLTKVLHQQLAEEHDKYYGGDEGFTPIAFTFNSFRSAITGLFQRMKSSNLV